MNLHAPAPDRDQLLHEARAHRVAGRVPQALIVLARLRDLHPRFSRLFQELAHCHILRKDAPAAIRALRMGLDLNPALPASWDMLEQLYRMTGDTAQAAAAAQQLMTLRQLPPELVMANSLHADGDLEPAETLIRDYLRAHGDTVGALRLLARIRMDCGDYDQAESLLQQVLERAPDYQAARFDYGMALLQQQKHAEARAQAEDLLAAAPDHSDFLKLYGAASIGLGDYEPLIDLYAKLLGEGTQPAAARPDAEFADLRLWRANALKITGRAEAAIADYHASIAARPESGAPWFALANLKTYRFSDDDLARMRLMDARPDLQDMDRVYLCFALGKALEDRGDYANSWRYYERGNGLRQQTSRYSPESVEACVRRLQQVFTADLMAERAGWGVDDPSPIFVLGLPRSGSTLIEQILASHSAVEGTQELPQIGRYAGEVCGLDPACGLPLDPQALLRLSQAQVRALGQRFLAETRTYRRRKTPFFIDKMPNNFWHIGLIRLILPQAKIIDIRREPMSCGFSNFKQLFGLANQEFSYDMTHIARHYRAYLDLMRHWDEVLPGQVLRVHYEDVVEDLDGCVRRLLTHCGLDYEVTCVEFHRTARSVRTPSSEQVRQPINRDGVEQWRRYESWLAPLQSALGDAITTYRHPA